VALRSGASVSGGLLDGTGRITVDGAAMAMNAANTAPIDLTSGSSFTLTAFANNSEIDVNPAGGAGTTALIFPGTQTLAGTGSVVLGATTNLSMQARINGPAAPDILMLGAGQTVRGRGTIGGNVMVLGALAPGIAPSGVGQIVFEQGPDLTGIPTIALKLASASSYDSLAMQTPYTLGGKLVVTLIGGFNPISTNLFTIVNAPAGATRTGGFDDFSLPPPPISVFPRKWRLNYLPQEVTLRLTCAADFNGDGLVNDQDFQYFAYAYDNLTCPTPASMLYPLQPDPCPADLNGDGVVQDDDFVIFVQAYNAVICQ
jgi:hypothetical protein